MEKSKERVEILAKIEELEKQGIFDQDVENDPPSLELFPNQIDYLHKKLKTKILTHLTLKAGGKFFKSQIDAGNLVIKDIVGWQDISLVSVYRDSDAEDTFDKYFGAEGIKKVEQKGLQDL